MESIKEVLRRISTITEDKLSSMISESRSLLDSGVEPVTVLVDAYGTDTQYLEELLTPVDNINV